MTLFMTLSYQSNCNSIQFNSINHGLFHPLKNIKGQMVNLSGSVSWQCEVKDSEVNKGTEYFLSIMITPSANISPEVRRQEHDIYWMECSRKLQIHLNMLKNVQAKS